MKVYTLRTKHYILILWMTFTCYSQMNAQNSPVANYLKQVGDFADIYNGRIEPIYNPLTYENLPYYLYSDFTEASVIFKNNYYPNQKVRLDLYKEQLIILPPEKKYGIVVSSQKVNKVFMYNKTFVLLDPPESSGIKGGYYIQLIDGEKIKLFRKETYTLRQKQIIHNVGQKQITSVFDNKTRYYLFYNNRYYTVKNKCSFTKLFSQHKKQISQYVKDRKFNFGQNAEASLTALVVYCEELITSTNK